MIYLRCPGCRGRFPWQTDSSWPRYCPLCGMDSSMDDKPEVAAPAILSSPKTKAAEFTYRAMEEGSEYRAKLAAAQLGVPESEVSDLKITNMNDRQRYGDAPVASPNNEVTRAMAVSPMQNSMGITNWGMQSSPQAAMSLAASAHTGPHAYAGAKAQQSIRQLHAANGGVVTEAPSLEVLARNGAGRGR